MGNWNECAEANSFEYEIETQDLVEADKIELLGVGSFARVWKVKLKSFENQTIKAIKAEHFARPIALKEFSKAYIVSHDDAELANWEVRLLNAVTPHPFISDFICSFQDKEKAYMLMEYIPWGDLLYHMKLEKKSISEGKLSEEQAKFMWACLVTALAHIHDRKVIHRDIKPDNIMIDDEGYPKIVDFGVADFEKDIIHGSHFGTLSYMAPEMVLNEPYSYSADYYSLGVLLLLILTGDMFAVGKTIEEAQQHVSKRRRTLTMKKLKKRYPFLSNECVDFLFKLLQGQPKERIGHHKGITEIKGHHWLVNVPWKQLEQKSFPSPLSKFVDNYKGNKTLGEQHYIGLNKRDLALKEKEDKSKELVQNAINKENDPDNDLFDHFNEFVKMNVNLLEEEIAYEELPDDQGSTYPDNNVFNKKQTTPSQGNVTNSTNRNGDNIENQEGIEVEYQSIKEYDKTNKNAKNYVDSIPENNMYNESEAIIQEILGDDCDKSVKLSVIMDQNTKFSKKESMQRCSKVKQIQKEKEIPLLTNDERMEYESVTIQSAVDNTEFIMTPMRPKKTRENGIQIPATKQMKPKGPPGNKLPE